MELSSELRLILIIVALVSNVLSIGISIACVFITRKHVVRAKELEARLALLNWDDSEMDVYDTPDEIRDYLYK